MGGYEQALPVAVIHTHRVRAFIRGIGVKAKSDRLDARMLALYGASTAPRLTPAPSSRQQRVARLSAWRRTLRDDIVAKTQHLRLQADELQASTQRVIATLQAELEVITATITDLIATAPDWARTRDILRSCPGVGPQTVALILADLPELGDRTAKELAALVGVAPFTRQSGAVAGTAAISGGRRHVRSGLWMPARTAMRHNPVIRAYAARLRQRGKHEKVVTVACLHQLVTILNAMVMHDAMWHSPPFEA